jgi:hypothetical protein
MEGKTMSQDPQVPLTGDWYVYRYNHRSRHVLKSSQTKLIIVESYENPGSLTCSFQLSGWDDIFEGVGVEMVFDEKSQAWHGEEDSIDLRWVPIKSGETDMLIGYALERSNSLYCDSFIAVREQRQNPLKPPPGQTLSLFFADSYLIPLKRGKNLKWGSLSLAQEGGWKIEWIHGKPPNHTMTHGETNSDKYPYKYEIEGSPTTYYDGLILTAKPAEPYKDDSQLDLWILPLDRPLDQGGHPLAIGTYTYSMFPPGKVSTRPNQPPCQISVQIC